MDGMQICVLLTIVLSCNGLSILDQLAHIQSVARRRNDSPKIPKIMRRFSVPGEPSVILGAPSYPHHLPKAEPILPGHTLIRPAIGMLKSAVKFPHIEQEDGSGVYGNYDSLGIKFAGKNERVLYTGFRRLLPQSRYSQGPKPPNSYQKKYRRYLNETPILQHGPRSFYHQNYQYVPRREKIFKKPEDTILGLAILIKRVKETDLRDIFRIMKSLRRDQEIKEAKKPKKLYVPGTANFGDFGILESDSENGEVNKTAMFWKTKNAFNHIKISPEAPNHSELFPTDAINKQTGWEFFDEPDFENFEDSRSKLSLWK